MLHTTRKFAEYVPVFGALSETSLQTLFAAPPRCSDLLGVGAVLVWRMAGVAGYRRVVECERECALVCAASL